MATKIPRRCRRGQHELIDDALMDVEVQRCKNCGTIPDPVQAEMWDYAVNTLIELLDMPLVDRFIEARRLIRIKMITTNRKSV